MRQMTTVLIRERSSKRGTIQGFDLFFNAVQSGTTPNDTILPSISLMTYLTTSLPCLMYLIVPSSARRSITRAPLVLDAKASALRKYWRRSSAPTSAPCLAKCEAAAAAASGEFRAAHRSVRAAISGSSLSPSDATPAITAPAAWPNASPQEPPPAQFVFPNPKTELKVSKSFLAELTPFDSLSPISLSCFAHPSSIEWPAETASRTARQSSGVSLQPA